MRLNAVSASEVASTLRSRCANEARHINVFRFDVDEFRMQTAPDKKTGAALRSSNGKESAPNLKSQGELAFLLREFFSSAQAISREN